MKLPTEAQQAEWKKLDAAIEAAKKELAAVPDAVLAAGQAKWEAAVRAYSDSQADRPTHEGGFRPVQTGVSTPGLLASAVGTGNTTGAARDPPGEPP